MRSIVESIQANKLKAISKELTALARKDRAVKSIVDQLNSGKAPSKQEIHKLKGETQDEVMIAFASVLGPTQTMKEYGVDVSEALQKGDTVTVKDRVKKWGKKKGTVTGTFGKEFMVRLKGRSGEVSFFPDELIKEAADIKKEYESLKKKSTPELKDIYKRSHRVSDTKGLSKNNLIFDILRAEHGDKRVDAALGEEYLNESSHDSWIVIYNYGQGRQLIYPPKSKNVDVMPKAKAEALAKKEAEKTIDKKAYLNKEPKVHVHARPLDDKIWNYVNKRSPAGYAVKDLLDDMKESMLKFGAFTNNLSEKEKLDPVKSSAAKKKFKNRKDKDIDNDGDVDSSDEYLHKRRKAIAKDTKEEHEVISALRSKIVNKLNEAAKTGRGRTSIKGSKYSTPAKDKKTYIAKIAPIAIGEAEVAIRSTTGFKAKFESVLPELKKRLEKSGVAFPGDRADIKSTTIERVDFSWSRLQWNIRDEENAEFNYTFHVMAESEVDNPEYGEVDELKGEVEHYIKFKITRGTVRILTVDTVWKNK